MLAGDDLKREASATNGRWARVQQAECILITTNTERAQRGGIQSQGLPADTI